MNRIFVGALLAMRREVKRRRRSAPLGEQPNGNEIMVTPQGAIYGFVAIVEPGRKKLHRRLSDQTARL